MKTSKAKVIAHTPKSSIGMGDFYGQAIKQKFCTIREDYLNNGPPSVKQVGKPPKSLA